MKARDLTGMKFGKLTALECLGSEPLRGRIWRCQCECGNIVDVQASRLTSGTKTHCGCQKKIKKEHPVRDLTGKKFGRLTALRYDHLDDKHREIWLFECDCGNQKLIPAPYVINGYTQSCGCRRKGGGENTEMMNKGGPNDLTGQKFGRLTAVHPTEKCDAKGSVIWKCKCDCGREASVSTLDLTNGSVKGCKICQENMRVLGLED